MNLAHAAQGSQRLRWPRLPHSTHTASPVSLYCIRRREEGEREDLNSYLGTKQPMPLARGGEEVWGRKGQVQVETEGGSYSQAAQRLGLLRAGWSQIPKRMRQWVQAKDWVTHLPPLLEPQKKFCSVVSTQSQPHNLLPHWHEGPWAFLLTMSCPILPYIPPLQAGQLGSYTGSKQLLHPTRGGGVSSLGEVRHVHF